MTPAASVSFFGSEFNNFLYAPIGVETTGMPLSVLSALARLNVDPWGEAAELSKLPKETDTQRLASLIARLPVGRWAPADCGEIADRLIELLPRRSSSKTPLAPREMTRFAVPMLICAALGVAALIIAANREPSSQRDRADVPAFSTASPPQSR